MMRKLSEQELAREPARTLAEASARPADALAVEVLDTFLRDELKLEAAQRRILTRKLWGALRSTR